MGPTDVPPSSPAPDQHRYRRWVLTAAALVAAAVHVWHPDLRIDGITLGLLALAALPWLAPLIKSIEIPGVGKVELQELERKTAEARGAADSATKKAEMALAGNSTLAVVVPRPPAAASPAPAAAPAAPAAPAPAAPGASRGDPGDAATELARLAEQYNHIRATQPRGPTRTGAMTAVIRAMMDLAPRLGGYDVRRALRDRDAGVRLGGYAYLLARPDFDLLPPLAQAVTELEDKPFGQYWGIQAVARVMAAGAPRKPATEVLQQLRDLMNELRPDTDRHYELQRLLQPRADNDKDD